MPDAPTPLTDSADSVFRADDPTFAIRHPGSATPPPRAWVPPEPSPEFPNRVGQYLLVREVGRGGMGVVYEATDARLKRTVAVKMILDAGGAGADILSRFQTEAEAVANLQHPNIVQIHEVGWHDGRPFVALEFLPGGTLQRRTGGKPQPPREAAGLVRVLAAAAHHAHARGVIHRDLKPANILFAADGTPKIADFGAARVTAPGAAGAGLTRAGEVIGTPQYMAPEQARGSPDAAGPPADVYALGAILYQLLTGRPPFDGPDLYDILRAVVETDPVPPRRLQPKVPRDLETVCLKCLERNTARRYASADDVAAELGRYLAGETIRAKPATPAERAWKAAARRPVEAGLAAGLILVGMAGMAGVVHQWRDAVAATAAAEANADLARAAEAAAAADRDAARLAEADARDARTTADAAAAAARTAEAGAAADRDKARAAEARAVTGRDTAAAATAAAVESLYAARIAQTAMSWEANEVLRAWRLIDACAPNITRPTVQDWEWRYLWGRCSAVQWDADLRTAGQPPGRTVAYTADRVAVSPDGTLAAVAAVEQLPLGPVHRVGVFVYRVADGKPVRGWSWQRPLAVRGVAWATNDRLVVVNASENARIYEVKAGRDWPLPAAPAGPQGRTPVFGRGGAAFARAEPGGMAVWDLAAEPPAVRYVSPAAAGEAPQALSADGRRLATADPAGTVRVYDVAAAAVVRTVPAAGPDAALDAAGTRLATCRPARPGTPARAAVWDIPSGRELAARTPANSPPVGLGFGPDGRFLVAAHGRELHVWDARANEFFALAGHAGPVAAAAFAPDGRAVATAGIDGTVRVWDPAGRREKTVLRGHIWNPQAVGFVAAGAGLVSGGADGRLISWDLTRDEQGVGTRPPASFGGRGAEFAAFGFTPDNKLTVMSTRGGLFALDPATMNPEARSRPAGVVPRASRELTDFAVGGGRVVIGIIPPTAARPRLWDAATGAVVCDLEGLGCPALAVAASADGRRVAAVGFNPATPDSPARVHVWDAVTGRTVAGRECPSRSAAIAFSPDGTRLAIGRIQWKTETAADVWAIDADTLAPLPTHPDFKTPRVLALAFDPTGTRLVGACWESQQLMMWDVPTARRLWVQPTTPSTGLAVSPDGRRVAAVGYDETVSIRAAADGAELLAVRGVPGRAVVDSFPARLAFSPDGRFLAANHAHGGLSVWSADRVAETDGPAKVREQARAAASAFRFHLGAAADAVRDGAEYAYRVHAAELDRLAPPNAFLAAEWAAFAPLADAGFYGPWGAAAGVPGAPAAGVPRSRSHWNTK